MAWVTDSFVVYTPQQLIALVWCKAKGYVDKQPNTELDGSMCVRSLTWSLSVPDGGERLANIVCLVVFDSVAMICLI